MLAAHRRHHRRALPGLRQQPVRQRAIPRDWTHRHWSNLAEDRAVVGHNLKIAWNLMRMNACPPSTLRGAGREDREDHAGGRQRPAARRLVRRGGAQARPGEEWHRFAWHDRKAWWQQEQAILAYLILAGTLGGEENRTRPARRRPSTTPSSSTTTRAPSTSTCWPAACRTCSAPSGSRAATR